MRTMLNPCSRSAQLAVGAALLAVPASAVALSAPPTGAMPVPTNAPGTLRFTLKRNPIRYGERVTVRGTAPAADSGRRLALQFAVTGGRWRTLATTLVRANGRFLVKAPLRESGGLRIADASAVSGSTAVNAVRAAAGTRPTTGPPAAPGAAVAPIQVSASRRVAVAAKFDLARGSIDALAGQQVDVKGRLLPGAAGRTVRLQEASGGRWSTIAVAHTRRNGRFDVRYLTAGTGRQRLRVRFRGDRLNSAAASPAGALTVYRQSAASWYDDNGSTACGFHAYYGVANKDLPCGAQVRFSYGGHTVTAVVDDRGPYVGGREWDLNQNTAAALGFGGVDNVWSSI